MATPNLPDEDSSLVLLGAPAGSADKPRRPRTVLVVEDDLTDFVVIQRALSRLGANKIKLRRANCLADGIACLAEGGIDAVLLDLGLPDSQSVDTFRSFHLHAGSVPVIVLTGVDDEAVAIRAAQEGAQDYLVKDRLDGDTLLRSLRYALVRHKSRVRLARALELARANETNLRNLIRSTVDGIVVVDRTGNVAFSNKEARILFDREKDEFENHPLGIPLNVDETIEMEVMRRRGRAIPVQVRTVAVEWERQPAQLVIFRDLTERRKREEERRHYLKTQHALDLAEHEIALAQKVQQSLFPRADPVLPGFDISGAVFPAYRASGDYFDFLRMAGGCLGIVIADVSGHGLGPAMLMAQTQAYLRSFVESSEDPGEIITHTNRLVFAHETGHFVELLFLRLDPATRSFVYASAGHRGYLLKAQGHVQPLKSTGVVLGVTADGIVKNAPVTALEPGDIILLMTDGIQETRQGRTNLFGTQRALEAVQAHRHQSARQIVQSLHEVTRDFAQETPQQDDITVVVVKAEADPMRN